MATFHYTAINAANEELRGSVEAGTLNDALSVIRRLGLYALEIAPAALSGNAVRWPLRQGGRLSGRGVRPEELVIFTRQLAVLLDAGLPLVRALGTVSRQARGESLRRIIGQITDAIQAGGKLSDALSPYPSVFSGVYLAMVRAGETGGSLDEVLRRLADFQDRNLRLARRITAALVYPVLVMTVAVVILGFVVTFVIPRFTMMFEDTGMSLPLVTRLVLETSQWLRGRWYVFLGGGACIVLLFRGVSRNRHCRLYVDRGRLALPVLGPLFQKIAAARFARTLSSLLSGGVHILPALALAKDVAQNEAVKQTIQSVYDSVREGGFIARALGQNTVFPRLMSDLVTVGEESGTLDTMLAKVAQTCEEEVEISANTLASLLEPLLIIMMGGIVGFIVLAMFLPLISLIQSLSQ